MDDILTFVDPRTSGCVYSGKKETTFATNSITLYNHSNKLVLHAFVTICLYMHTFNLQLDQRVLCVCKPKSAEWASRCAILHGISTITPQALLAT